jgi:predicted RNase H-like nuclease
VRPLTSRQGLNIHALIAQAEADGPISVVAIDMPIGLPDRGYRQADILARAAIGSLWPSVFMTPVREALLAADHAAASSVNRQLTGQGISIQAFALKPKLLQVEQWARQTHIRVVEIHPEVCFARLAGAPLTVRKSSWAGAERRHALLAGVGIEIAGGLDVAGAQAAVDDILDAGAAAWAARQVLLGVHSRSPTHPKHSVTAGRVQSGRDQDMGGRTGRLVPRRPSANVPGFRPRAFVTRAASVTS